MKHSKTIIMKKVLITILFFLFAVSYSFRASAQVKVSDINIYNSDILHFIPPYLTKDCKPIFYVWNYTKNNLTVYDENMAVVKNYNLSSSTNFTYQERYIHYKRLMDPDTKELLSDWEVESDNTYERDFPNQEILNFKIYSENGKQEVYLTQTLFDEDEDFEFIRSKYEAIPIETNNDDYYKAKGVYKEREPDEEWLRDYGAYEYETQWDDTRQKNIWVLKKYEYFGGLDSNIYEIVNLDGIVEKTLDFLSRWGTAIYVYGNFYVQGNDGIYRLNNHKLPESTAYGPNFDLNRDGKVNVADHVELSNIIMNQNK